MTATIRGADQMLEELQELHPDIDWEAVLDGDYTGITINVADLADELIAAGCDPEAVRRYVLDAADA